MISADHLILLPIFTPLVAGVTGLILHRWQRLQAWLSLAGMGASLAATVKLTAQIFGTASPLVYQAGGWQAPFGISFVADPAAGLFVLMSQSVFFLGIIHAMGSRERCTGFSTFYPFFLFLASGLTGCMLTGDIFNLFVFVEVVALSGTVLTSISDDSAGTEAAFKYFFMGQLAAFFMLLGIGALYVSCGTLNMAHLARIIPETGPNTMLPLAVAFLCGTFMIKGACFPFHFWQPDLYNAAPTSVAAMLSSVVGKLGIYGLIRMTQLLFIPWAEQLSTLLVALGVIGIAFGGLSAMGTGNARRMLAYSTMAQTGFILVAIGWGSALSLAAALVFTFNHSLIKSGMLMLTGHLSSVTDRFSASFAHLKGSGRGRTLSGVLFFVGGLSLAGIPPTNGFISKMLVFRSGIETDSIPTLILMGIFSVFTLIYFTRAFMVIFWQKPDIPCTGETVKTGDSLLAPLVLISLVAALGFFAAPLADTATTAATSLTNPQSYIAAVLGGVQ